jgi:hypothetical protein
MKQCPHSKRGHYAPFVVAGFDRPCSSVLEPDRFRPAENSSKAVAGTAIPIVHTGSAFDPTALPKLPIIKTA